jgi:hypothetical protein
MEIINIIIIRINFPPTMSKAICGGESRRVSCWKINSLISSIKSSAKEKAVKYTLFSTSTVVFDKTVELKLRDTKENNISAPMLKKDCPVFIIPCLKLVYNYKITCKPIAIRLPKLKKTRKCDLGRYD